MSIDGAEYSRREADAVFRVLKGIAGIYSRAFHRTRLVRPCRLPTKGPAILVCNHVSSIDPILLQSFSPRLVRWMMAKEYFDYKSMRWLYQTMGVILVQRSGRDLAATRAAMRVLASGYVLGVFPEGRLETTRDLIPFQSGIGLLAVKTRAPVYPAFLDGTQRNREMVEAVLTPSVASIAFAPPVDFADLTDSKAGVLEATRRIQAAVEALRDFGLSGGETPRKRGR
ncbi:MAG: lysophospholipid acyltransferase family protein [Tepidisphaeraceae bacterium]